MSGKDASLVGQSIWNFMPNDMAKAVLQYFELHAHYPQ